MERQEVDETSVSTFVGASAMDIGTDDPTVSLLEASSLEKGTTNAEDGSEMAQGATSDPTPYQRRLQEMATNEGPTDEEINVGDWIGMGSFSDHPQMEAADVTVSLDTSVLPGGHSIYCIFKSTNVCYVFYLGCLASILLAGLIANGTTTCEKPLIVWSAVEFTIFVVLIGKSLALVFDVPLRINAMDRTSSLRRCLLGGMYVGHRIVNFIWFVWFIFGAVWTMDAQSKCSEEAFPVWVTSLIVVVIQMAALGLLATLVACGCCCICILYFMFPSRFGGNRGASKKLIEKTTKSETFSAAESGIAKEDAMCAICLSEYVDGEKIRYLPCDHHFHSDCVDQWLTTNKSCASCRRLIDSPVGEKEAPLAPAATIPVAGDDNV